MPDEIKNVFISHIHEDDDDLAKLKELAAKHGLQIRDYSITADKPNNAKDPDYIKQKILTPQIEWASTLAVYVSKDTLESKWVNWEIEKAHELGKRIVGIWQNGAMNCEIPEALDKYGDAMVGWSGGNIVDAITGKSEDWYKPTGDINDYRPIRRYGC